MNQCLGKCSSCFVFFPILHTSHGPAPPSPLATPSRGRRLPHLCYMTTWSPPGWEKYGVEQHKVTGFSFQRFCCCDFCCNKSTNRNAAWQSGWKLNVKNQQTGLAVCCRAVSLKVHMVKHIVLFDIVESRSLLKNKATFVKFRTIANCRRFRWPVWSTDGQTDRLFFLLY